MRPQWGWEDCFYSAHWCIRTNQMRQKPRKEMSSIYSCALNPPGCLPLGLRAYAENLRRDSRKLPLVTGSSRVVTSRRPTERRQRPPAALPGQERAPTISCCPPESRHSRSSFWGRDDGTAYSSAARLSVMNRYQIWPRVPYLGTAR